MRGQISRIQVLAVSLTGLFLSVIVLTYLNPVILLLGILSVAGLLSYTFFKNVWWGGPPWNAWIVALLPVIGRHVDPNYSLAEVGSAGTGAPGQVAFILAILAIFFAYANFVIMGYFKDISADRETGYNTFPVVFGWKPAARYSDVIAVLAFLFTAGVLVAGGEADLLSVGILIPGAVLSVAAQVGIHRTRDECNTHGPITNVVRVFILYCLAVVAAYKGEWILGMVIFYLLFEATLRVRPEKSQV